LACLATRAAAVACLTLLLALQSGADTPVVGNAPLVLSEFMASNTRTLADEDGDFEDWIEVHNYGSASVDLLGWSLTDSASDLTRWTFPATNLNAGGYLVVFASNKNRRAPGQPLHTNFRLSASGEYLALVLHGTNVVSQFAPVFPAQVPDVSYGLHQNAGTVALVASNAPVRVRVPGDDSLGLTWTDPGFDAAAWLAGTNGVGFEVAPGEPGEAPYGPLIATDVGSLMHAVNASAYLRLPFHLDDPTEVTSLTLKARYDDGFAAYLNGVLVADRNAPVSATVADSVAEFSGTQGQGNWLYGYYNQSADAVPGYQPGDFAPFPRAEGPHSASNYWTGSIWDWYAGNPPWDTLDANGGHPNGSNNGQVHWAIRRWVSEAAGTLRLSLRHAKANTGGGNGTTARVLHNGLQVFSNTVAGTDGLGRTAVLLLSNVVVGDPIDFAIDPLGTDGTQGDGFDGTVFTASVEFVAPELTYNSAATTRRSNALGREFESLELGAAPRWLLPGQNVLAVHGLNLAATNTDFLFQGALEATVPLPLSEGSPRYFPLPTPGGPNGAGTTNLGPIIAAVAHTPAQPLDSEDLLVTARLSPAFAPVASNSLVYRVMFGAEVTVPMFDDGAHGDGAAGDGIFGGVIPASASTSGQMVRWYLSSRDTLGRVSRWPAYSDPIRTPQYLGTVVQDPALTNPLPVLHWFAQNPGAADTDAGTRVSLFFLGEFYDNVAMNIHGQSSRGFPKKSYDLEFNPGYKFRWHPDRPRVGDVNWMTTYPDKAHMRNLLAYESFEALGSPYHWTQPVRVQQNGVLYGTAHLMENGDEEFIERLGLNPENPLYKMYNTFTTSPAHATLGTQNVEKKSRKWEGSADLQALLNAVLLTGEARRAYFYDNLDLPEILNTMAARALIGDQDCCHKNYYFYRDTLGDGEWEIWPWDVDLCYGRRWITGLTYWDDQMILDTRMPVGENNGLLAALYATPEIREMYWRRQRTLLDEFLQPLATPPEQLRVEQRIDEWAAVLAPDAALDLARWGTWCCGGAGPYTQATIPIPTNYQALRQAADLMKFGYLPQRRAYLYNTRTVGNGGEIPAAQPADARVLLAAFEVNPPSGNQAEEFIVLTNGNTYAVDISGWRLTGAVAFTFKPGTVIPAGRVLYVSPDVKAFRARVSSPRGGQSLFVVGPYRGQLSARGETVRLLSAAGRLADSWRYPAAPTAAQLGLRVTEIMYHPAPPAGPTNEPDAFEFIEVKNIGAVPLNLTGVRFDQGITFDFTGSAVTMLAPGARAVVVRDLAAFASRYPAVPAAAIAGRYTGALDNSGERLRLLDTGGEEILDFEFNDAWHPITDGLGFSLVVVDEHAEPDAWSRRSQWRPGGLPGGTPGEDEPPIAFIPPARITEALSRSEPPLTDFIELHNPTEAPADIGGWWLTDDFDTPAKFRVPPGTVIPAGGRVIFDESHFNPGGAGFALSAEGEEVWLFSADAAGKLTGYAHGHKFGAADGNVSFGLQVTSDGREHFVAQVSRTPGASNDGPAVGPLVITEIHYRPPDLQVRSGLKQPEPVDNSTEEYIEIQNISADSVPLSVGGRSWRLRGGVDLDLPPQAVLASGEFALLVNFSPSDAAAVGAFRARFNVPPTVQIFGPCGGKLNNAGDRVELWKPGLLGGVTPVEVLVDQVYFEDEAPWPAGADGFGYSLQRWNAAGFGNEPANWVAAMPTAAAPTLTNALPPAFVRQPQGLTVVAGTAATLAAEASGTPSFSYQWLFNGASLSGATNAALTLGSAALEHDGDYTLLVWNAAGLAVSVPARLTVAFPPTLQQAPTNVLLLVPPDPAAAPGTNAVFTVVASSRSALTYQWRFNGTNLPGATASTLTLTNVTTNSLGTVGVTVSDGLASVEASAGLYPLVRPVITQGPLGQEVPVGARVTLSAQYAGWPPPFTNVWQLGALGLVTNASHLPVSFFTFSAPGVVATQDYRFVVRNLARPGGVASGFARIVTVPDTDGDGLPDAWESAYGLAPGNPADRDGDLDGDGQSNWAEYVAGTDPTNALSYLRVERLTDVPGVARIEFLAVSNRTYTVEYADDLPAGPWRKLGDLLARASNGPASIQDADATTHRFYRLVTPRLSP
jgi:hypothetical protein